MTVNQIFKDFCINLRMADSTVEKIRLRYRQITKRINLDYYNLISDTENSLYVGSYGRGTDIFTSDIDLIVKLPYEKYVQYDNYQGNGQSALLQDVRNVLKKTYSTSHLRADGQVIVISFDDGIRFEIVPAFINKDQKSYTYPNTNNGGSWGGTNPRAEKEAINKLNNETNKNLKRLCRMTRAWKNNCSVPITGYLIDTLAYKFLKDWEYKNESFLYYDWMTRDFFKYLMDLNESQEYWIVPGSNNKVYKEGNFQYKAKLAYNKSLEAISKLNDGYEYTAKGLWREIYGSKFPS